MTYRVHYTYSGRNSFDITAPSQEAAMDFFRQHIRPFNLREHTVVQIVQIEERSDEAS